MVKRIAIAVCLILIPILAACRSSIQISGSIETPFLLETTSLTYTPVPSDTPIPTVTFLITPKITATPINASIETDDDLNQLIEQLYPMPCIGFNFAKSTKTDVLHASKLNLIEVDLQPDSKQYWVSEVADNVDQSRRAFVACKPELCQDKIYVQNRKTGIVYEIDWDHRMPWRPIQWITWINNDTLSFLQSSNPDHALIIAINFDKSEVLYEAIVFPDYYCVTSTPTL